jgi:hypothetical protein
MKTHGIGSKPKIFGLQTDATRSTFQQAGLPPNTRPGQLPNGTPKPGAPQTGTAQSQKAATSQKTATSQSASTGYSNSDVFSSSGVKTAMAKDLSMINGGSGTSSSPDDIIASAEVNALTNPAQAADLLKNGIKDPKTGRPLAGPIDPSSDLGKLLTKVANNQPVTASDLETAAGVVKDRSLVSKSVMAGLDNTMQSITSQYNQMQQTADTAGGDDSDDDS